MGLIGIRRRLMMGAKKVLDTSPIILQYDVKNPNGNPAIKPYIDNVGYCVTVFYNYTPSTSVQTIVHCNADGYAILYNNDTYCDFWNLRSPSGLPASRACINANTNRISLTILTNYIDTSYAYIIETGEILFAGKNSPYYGYTNINDMPT